MNRWFGLALLLILGAALALRLPQLERRPMHNDEAVNALKFRNLWAGGGYRYDPDEFHGPTLPYSTALVAALTGQSADTLTETTVRMVPLLFGIGLILLLPLLADGLGRGEALWAAGFLAVSPAMVFYSRYYIHELLLVFFSALLLAAGWRYVQTARTGWCLLAGFGLGMMYATKETFVFALAAMGLALGFVMAWKCREGASLPDVALLLKPKPLLLGLGVALFVSLTLFTSFFSNASGPIDSVRTYLPWIERARGNSPHEHPWYFYLRRLLFFQYPKGPVWSEALIFLLGIGGIAAAFSAKWAGQTTLRFIRMIALYTIALIVIYTVIPYKTPWCLLGFWHGMILMAGVGAMALLRRFRNNWQRAVVGAVLVAGAGHLSWQAWRASFPYDASQFNPYVYAHTSPDLLKLIEKVEALSRVSPDGHRTLVKVMAANNDYWPLPWYLRRFQNAGWWGQIPEDPLAPLMIVSASFQAAFDERPEKTHLMAGYFQIRPQVFLELYVELNLWRAYVATLPRERD